MKVGGGGRRRRRHRTLDTVFDHDIGNDHGTKIKARKVASLMSGGGDTMKSSKNSRSKCWTIIASSALFAFMVPVTSSVMLPAWGTQLSSTGMGRNIRHLPCVSRRTGETGLCMFAYSCAKANGTHLGTCIDRFYFGSCCKIASGTDIDLVEPIAHNHLSNKDDSASSTVRTTYQKPSPTNPSLPNFADGSSSTMPMPVSLSTMSRPLSVVSSPSTPSDTYSSTFVKTSSSKPPAAVHTVSYDSSATSRTPLVNVTFSQSYSSQASHVTTSPLVYSTTVTTTFQSGTHKPALPAASTTAYSKPITKPTSSKPSVKPKPPSQNTGKPGPTKPKPKPTAKPSTSTSYPAAYTPSASPTISTFLNKTTLHAAFTNNGLSSKPSALVTEPTVPIKPYPSSTSSPSSSFTQFTSSKKPTKPSAKPTFTTPSTPQSSNNYVKIPVSTVPAQNKPTSTISSLSSHMQTVHTIHTTSTYSTPTPSSESDFLRVNTSVSENEITEKPSSHFWTTTSEKLTTRPWSSSSLSTTTITSHPSLVTWTTIEEVPAIIIPDRTKPTSIIKPSGKPPVTKPTFLPTFSKPSTAFSKPSPSKPTKPITTKPDIEESYRPTITMTSPSSTTTSSPTTAPSWVEVSVSTHAPSSAQAPSSPESSSAGTTGTFTYTPSKPSTTITVPVASPLPIETTQAPIETNEIESASLNMSDYREVCGRRLFPNARIVGGEKATFGEWPWQISLRQWRPSSSTYLHKCGAALFNENWAVTAAHCVENVPPSDLLLRLGEYDLSTEEEPYGFQERRVQIVASHPQFDPRTFEYDLALLRFYEPVQFQPNIIPICVPDDDTNFVGSTAYVTGWGRLYDDGPLPNVLQEVSVPVINNSMCESMYQAAGYIEHIPNIFICAGWRKGGFDSCEGDSGGPMVIQRSDKRWLLAGIISWGIGCAEPNQPGVYTRISAFRDWINQILQF